MKTSRQTGAVGSYLADLYAQDPAAGRLLLRRAFQSAGGNFREAAKILDLDRRGLLFWLERNGLMEEAREMSRAAKARFRLPPL